MSNLYIDRRDIEISVQNKCLKFKNTTNPQGSIPLSQLERVVIRGKVTLTSSLIAELCDAGIGVLLLSGRSNRKLASFVGKPHNDVYRRLGQFGTYVDLELRINWSRKLVIERINSQILLLQKALCQRKDKRKVLTRGIEGLQRNLSRVSDQNSIDSLQQLLGIEGSSTRIYFKSFSSLFPKSVQFNGRNRRPPKDPVNSCLSLGFTLLHHEAVIACHQAGLDPMLGIYHEPKFGRESLACDIVEPVRCHVEKWVWQQFREKVLEKYHFSYGANSVLLTKTGRHNFYSAFNDLSLAIRRLLRIRTLAYSREFEKLGKKQK